MEVDSIEDFFGPEAFAGLKENIKQQWEANRQRIDSLIAVRKVNEKAHAPMLPWEGISESLRKGRISLPPSCMWLPERPTPSFSPPLLQSISTSILAASQHRVMVDDPVSQSQFLQHFVPSGPSDLGMPTAHGAHTSSTTAAAMGDGSIPSGSKEGEFSRAVSSFSPLPATFEELCQIQTSTVHRPKVMTDSANFGTTDGPASHIAALGGQLALSRAAFVPGGAAAQASTAPSWRSPKPKVTPSAFSGNMSACLGDMMEALTGGRQALFTAGFSGPDASTSRSLSSLSGGGGWGARAEGRGRQPPARGSPNPEATSPIDSGSNEKSWSEGWHGRRGAASSSPLGWSSAKAAQHSGSSGQGGSHDRSATMPVLGSPALLTKTKLEPIMSPAVSRLQQWALSPAATGFPAVHNDVPFQS